VVAIDTARDEVVSTVEVTGNPVRLRVTPDGKTLIATTIEAGDVAIIDTATLIITKRFAAGTNAEGLQLDPSGKYLYVAAQGDAKVIRYSVGDWKRLLEIKTAARPDPILIIPARR
jgi:DNA-binding beta-propeller fold protein YncE